MAKLTGQTIADSYDQLLIVTGASGITSSLQAVESGDTDGAVAALQISTVAAAIDNPTASSATQGGKLTLFSDDGAALGDTHRLGVLEFSAAEDTGSTITIGARIEAIADAAWSASENGADMVFYTTDGNASQSEVMRLTADSGMTTGVDDTGVDVRFYSATTNEGLLYDASEDELGLLLTTKLKFHDIGGGEEIFASANGHLEINAGTTLDITAPTVDINAATAVTIDSPAVTIASSGADDNLVITSTDADAGDPAPDLVLYRNSSSPADGDDTGRIEFRSRNDNSQDFISSVIQTFSPDVSDGSEDGSMGLYTMVGGTLRSKMWTDNTETVFNAAYQNIDFRVGGDSVTHTLFVDAAGDRVYIGTDTNTPVTGINPPLQISGTAYDTSSFGVNRYSADATPGYIVFGKSRGTSVGSFTSVVANDNCGSILWVAADGTDMTSNVARIDGEIDGTPGGNDTPGRISFHTTPDGGTGVTERMRIESDGNIQMGSQKTFWSGAYGGAFEIKGDNGTSDRYIRLKTVDSNGDDVIASGLMLKHSNVFIGDDGNANMTQGLTINQGSNDDEILDFKSSDMAHGMTDWAEADSWCTFLKYSGTDGGAYMRGFSEANHGGIVLASLLNVAADTTKSTSGVGAVHIRALTRTGTDATTIGSDGNLFVIINNATTRFIFDAEGSFHADVESTTYDAYDDAQLVRAYDLSHGKGMIESQFDKFIDYNHETLAELKLVGREKDGTPNRMVNVTGMQHLHNGAIWQQYTEMQKMKELIYDTMVEMLGKEKADQKLTDHDIKLLDNKTLLN